MEFAADTETLVEQAKHGSQSACEELVRQHHVLVRSFLGRMLRDLAAVDDLAQEVFLAAFRQLADYRGSAAFPTWLLGIARNQALNHMRGEVRRRRRDQRAFDVALAEWRIERLDDAIDSAHEQERRLRALRKCVDGLPHASRSVVDRFYFENKSAEVIARELNKNSGAVRMMLLRIRRALGKCVAEKLGDLEYES